MPLSIGIDDGSYSSIRRSIYAYALVISAILSLQPTIERNTKLFGVLTLKDAVPTSHFLTVLVILQVYLIVRLWFGFKPARARTEALWGPMAISEAVGFAENARKLSEIVDRSKVEKRIPEFREQRPNEDLDPIIEEISGAVNQSLECWDGFEGDPMPVLLHNVEAQLEELKKRIVNDSDQAATKFNSLLRTPKEPTRSLGNMDAAGKKKSPLSEEDDETIEGEAVKIQRRLNKNADDWLEISRTFRSDMNQHVNLLQQEKATWDHLLTSASENASDWQRLVDDEKQFLADCESFKAEFEFSDLEKITKTSESGLTKAANLRLGEFDYFDFGMPLAVGVLSAGYAMFKLL